MVRCVNRALHSTQSIGFTLTTYNTGSDAANTIVRAFLTKVGEFYLGRSFNTGSGRGKADWLRIQKQSFNSECAYCGEEPSRLTIEHLIMFNRSECGLHHPGNIVPCCSKCNKRHRDAEGKYLSWQEHLLCVCDNLDEYKARKRRIVDHMENEEYPKLTEDEMNALKAIANHLYSSTKSELDKSLALYEEIDATLVNRR